MLLLDGISVGGQSTRERGFTPVMSVKKLSSLGKCLASIKFGSSAAMCSPARVVARSSDPTTASTDTISLCVVSFTSHERDFPLPYISQWERLEFLFLNSGKIFLGFPFRSRIMGFFFGNSRSCPE